jgi:ankyrin repeat protein
MGNTALVHAARRGHTATVSTLVRLGADVNKRNGVGRGRGPTALHTVTPSQRGRSALTLAVFNGHTATAAELVRLSADINAKDNVSLRALANESPARASWAWCLADCRYIHAG